MTDHISTLALVPPQALDLEKAVLGAIMLEKHALSEVIDILSPETFYQPSHQMIYEAILDLYRANSPVDMLTVTQKLRDKTILDEIGGPVYITQLTNGVSSSANIVFHATVIRECYTKRYLIEISTKIQHECYQAGTDALALLSKITNLLTEAVTPTKGAGFQAVGAAIREAIHKIDENQNRELTGVPSGFTAIDKETGGFQDTDLIILAARPGMGKTSLLVKMMRECAKMEFGVAMFSAEMSTHQLMLRILAAEGKIPLERFRKNTLTEQDVEQMVQRVAPSLEKLPLYVDDSSNLSLLTLKAKLTKLINQLTTPEKPKPIRMMVLDYLQLLTVEGVKNREREISTISAGLKNIAKEFNIPVIALSQLSRAVETRGGDKKPMLSDLRDSGSIEQDADLVMFLYRPEYYGIKEDAEGYSTENLAEVIIAKHRNGSLSTPVLKFQGAYTEFLDMQDMPDFNPKSLPAPNLKPISHFTGVSLENYKPANEAPF